VGPRLGATLGLLLAAKPVAAQRELIDAGPQPRRGGVVGPQGPRRLQTRRPRHGEGLHVAQGVAHLVGRQGQGVVHGLPQPLHLPLGGLGLGLAGGPLCAPAIAPHLLRGKPRGADERPHLMEGLSEQRGGLGEREFHQRPHSGGAARRSNLCGVGMCHGAREGVEVVRRVL
jgi:hypothetical protein